MSRLTNDQLLLFDQLNHSRLKLLQLFRSTSHPDPGEFFQQLLRLEVLAMEHRHKEKLGVLFKENEANLDLIMENMLVKQEADSKLPKLSIRWKPDNG
jgi:hypothetical protein